jgi:type I restriction enzyme R subunit
LGGKAKAMVVVSSRQEAVRWKLAIDKYIAARKYPLRSLVAFSGEVNDPESGPAPFAETSVLLNPTLKGRDMREAFKTDEFQILLVANKFQTGFDQPLLCGMYVDKRLAGIQAVQTLSRLNRCYPGKDTTYVLDFVNDTQEVLEAFKTYYDTAELADVTDPNIVFNLRAKLDASGHYDDFEVNRVVAVDLKPGAKQSDLVAALEPVVDRLHRRYKTAQEALKAARETKNATAEEAAKGELDALLLFQRDMGTFVRLYTYLSQIFDYGSTDIEKRAIFFKHLLRLLEFGREREGVDLSKIVLTHHTLKSQGKHSLPLGDGEAPKLEPLSEAGGGSLHEKQKALMSEIVQRLNDLFEGDLTDGDQLVYAMNVIRGKMLESPMLRTQAANNTKEQFSNSPDLKSALTDAIIESHDAHTAMSTQALESERVRNGLLEILLGPAQLYEALRQ